MQYINNQINNKKEASVIERAIIGSLSHKQETALILVQMIKDHWFINDEHRLLYNVIKKSVLNNESPIPEVSKISKSVLFAECMTEAPFSTTQVLKLPDQLKSVWFRYVTQETIQTYAEKKVENPNTIISELWADLTKITEGNEVEQSDFQHMFEEYKKVEDEYVEKAKSGKEIIGYKTGFDQLDKATDGLRDGHLQIWGGYTSAGKTFAVLNVAYNLIEQGIPVSIYSLEMSKVDIFKRLLGIITGKSSALLLKRHDLDKEILKSKEDAIKKMELSGLRVHTERFLLEEILMNMAIEKQSGKSKVFIIDYAQLVSTGDESEYDTMRMLAMKLQNFCRKHNVPVVLVSQVSNESAKNPENGIIGFKGSGALAASADVAIELISGEDSRDDRDQKIAEGEPVKVKMVVKKNRHGRIFNTTLWFQPICGRFYNEDPDPNFNFN